MRNKTREEKYGGGCFQIARISDNTSIVKIIPHMIERHYHHDNATQQVDGFNSLGFEFNAFQNTQ